jgi:predicted amidophosphoribosyltransferase
MIATDSKVENCLNCGKKIEHLMGSCCRNCGTERPAVSKDTFGPAAALNLAFEQSGVAS